MSPLTFCLIVVLAIAAWKALGLVQLSLGLWLSQRQFHREEEDGARAKLDAVADIVFCDYQIRHYSAETCMDRLDDALGDKEEMLWAITAAGRPEKLPHVKGDALPPNWRLKQIARRIYEQIERGETDEDTLNAVREMLTDKFLLLEQERIAAGIPEDAPFQQKGGPQA
jgi:hypothetical protein